MNNKPTELSLEKICRSCMTANEEMHNVFEVKAAVLGRTAHLSEMLMACASIQVTSGDGLPFLLCITCENKLNAAFEFKHQSENSDKVFRNIINQPDINNTFKSSDVILNKKNIEDDYMKIKEEQDVIEHTVKTENMELWDKSFTNKSHLNNHLQTHVVIEPVRLKANEKDKGKKVMECKFCNRKFKYKKSFQHHMQTEHDMSDKSDGEGKSHTKANQKNDVNLDQIMDEEDKTEKIAWEPSTVDQTNKIVSNDDNGIHIKVKNCFANKVHLSVLVHKCTRCDKVFATADHLEKHNVVEHVNKPYVNTEVCTICNKSFSRGEHLIRHLKVHETPAEKDENLKCSICDDTIARSDHLATHAKVHLSKDKRHVCSYCGKAFNLLDNLKIHQKSHTAIKDTSKLHLCIYCGKEFKNSGDMIVHMRRHTGEKPYKCSQCDKGFHRSYDLKCHERTHTGEKPYECTVCGKSFNKSYKLLRHNRVHTGERPYVCSICGRDFIQSNDLALHMRKHTGARPYACGVCPARFVQSGHLISHRRTTGHWMETKPDLKGSYRVEPVSSATNPTPIRFRSRGKYKKKTLVEEVQPLVLSSSEFIELQGGDLVTMPAIHQTSTGNEIKLKSDLDGFDLKNQDLVIKHDVDGIITTE